MELKRLYDHAAPRERWVTREEPCPTCRGKGVIVNEDGTGVAPCPGAEIKAGGLTHPCVQGLLQVTVPPVRAVELRRLLDHQHFSPVLIEQGEAEGWITRSGTLLTLTGVPADAGTPFTITYQLVQAPGHHCCHCDRPLDDEASAKRHVARLHAGVASPDPNNPSGYRRDHFYAGVRLEGGTPLSLEDATAAYRARRRALHEKVFAKYGDARAQAARGRAAKQAPPPAEGGWALVRTILLILAASAALIAGQWILATFFGLPGIAIAADFVYNVAKGRVAELYNRVDTNDPANSALIVVILATTGLETDAVLKDKDTLADVVAGTTNEVTNTGYARKVLTDADIVAFAPDDTNDRVDLDIPDQIWTGVGAGDGWNDLLVCYDSDTTAGTDANIVPMTQHDFVVTPDGSDITAAVAAAGFYRAS